MDDEDYEMFKIVVIGDSGTGKTNITTRFVKDEYYEGSKATVGVEFLAKVIKVQNTQVKITFWDTAGQERYKSLSKVYYKGAAGIIIVYDITNPTSYSNVESWMRLANENLNINEVKMILIGNKIDNSDNRKVTYEKAKADYKERFDIECFETSAKTGEGVKESIMFLVESIYAMNTKIKGSQMPFDQDYEDDDLGANDMGSVIPTNKGNLGRPESKPTSNADAFKKSKNTDTTPSKSTKPTSKPQPQKNTSTSTKPTDKGTRLTTSNKKKKKQDGGCC